MSIRAPLPSKRPWLILALVVAAFAWTVAEHFLLKESGRVKVSLESGNRPVDTIVGGYDCYEGCRWVDHRGNDGDSFRVRLPDGRTEEFRLYFVDAPESAFREYRNGETNHARIRDQAGDLGGITPEQAVEAGREAKELTHSLLAGRPFTLFTSWDSPFHDKRYHAFIEVDDRCGSKWLHEELVKRGLVRIHTKGADLPDGTPESRHEAALRSMEAAARHAGEGVWKN